MAKEIDYFSESLKLLREILDMWEEAKKSIPKNHRYIQILFDKIEYTASDACHGIHCCYGSWDIDEEAVYKNMVEDHHEVVLYSNLIDSFNGIDEYHKEREKTENDNV